MAALTLGLAALGKRLSTGFSNEQAAERRPEATNLGWGTANFIATLLMLLTPALIAVAAGRRDRLRWIAWSAVLLSALMQFVIASRAAAVLFVAGTVAQVLLASGRRTRWFAVPVVAVFALLFASPLGQSFLVRFTQVRELGSMTVRIWYWREGWRRLVDHLPFGLGLGGGYGNADKLHGTDPHNYWLVVGGDLGVPGLLLWLLVLVVTWRAIGRIARTPEWRSIGNALRIGFVTGQIHTLVEPTFQGVQYQFVYFWLMGGMIAYHAAEAGPPRALDQPSREAAASSSAR
jgi:hypothetical protein